MMFLLEMMLACALIVMTSTVMTMFALSLMGWALAAGRYFDRVQAPADASIDDEAHASRAIS